MIQGIFRWLLLAGMATSLIGCVLIPGSNIDPSRYSDDRSQFFTTGGTGTWFPGILSREEREIEATIDDLVNIVAITPDLVRTQQALRPEPVPAGPSAQFQRELQEYDYRIAKGDVLGITVYNHPELTIPAGSMRTAEDSGNIVRSNGTIYYPYIGDVQVEGMTVYQVRDVVTDLLTEYLTEPQVDVRVVSFRAQRAYITGQVRSPGPQPITNVPLTVLDAISQAGGLSDSANWHNVLLSRNGQEYRLSVYEMLNNGRLGQNMVLRNGDILHIPVVGDQQVFVLGELNRVNALSMGNMRMSLTEALTRSGGLNQITSNARGIFVIRQLPPDDEKMATVYQLDVRNALNFAVGAQFMLEPTDIVYVTTAPVTRWNRVLSQLLPNLSFLRAVDRAGFDLDF